MAFEIGRTYRTRGGGTATVIEETGEMPWPLAVRYRSDYTDVVTADGRRWNDDTEDPRDLLPGAIDAETGGGFNPLRDKLTEPQMQQIDHLFSGGAVPSDAETGGEADELLLPEAKTTARFKLVPEGTPPEVETIWDRDVRAALGNPEICTGKAAEHDLAEWFPGRIGITRFEIAAKQASLYADALGAIRAERGRVG